MRSVSAPARRPAVLEHLRVDAEIAVREITRELDEIEIVSIFASLACYTLADLFWFVASRCVGCDGGCSREGELRTRIDKDVEERDCPWRSRFG